MDVSGLGGLLALAFLAGLMSAAVLLRSGRLRSRRRMIAAAALPFICLGVPLALLVVAAVFGGLMRWISA
ncbi:hypothetical protein [Novosphingobium sp. 9]|uniref:hypothetical protein n=1 Tax=Novosphingobium sp. 9 TaxID=2025349 RepID=UPI0021B60679|nr:hypothetical protein [Novosphingobium sp. 9]